MTGSERISRTDAITIARSWLGTPYVLRARIKGAGCDCATVIAEYLIEAGFMDREDLGAYSHDWFCHASEERYLVALMRSAQMTLETKCMGSPDAKPGNVVLFRVAGSKRYNHGAIVTAWPMGIHADCEKVSEVDLVQHPMTSFMEMAIFDPWGLE